MISLQRKTRRLAVLALLGGLFWMGTGLHLLATIRTSRESRQRHLRRTELLQRLAPPLERMTTRGLLRARLIEALDTEQPWSFAEWIRELPEPPPLPGLQERRSSPGAFWQLVTLQADWPAIPPETFGELVQAAESRFPPLRLVSVKLDPLPGETRTAVSALFETLVPSRHDTRLDEPNPSLQGHATP